MRRENAIPKIHYPYWYRLDNADAYLVWYTYDPAQENEPDGVLLDEAGLICTSSTLTDLHVYMGQVGLTVEPEVNQDPLNLDVVQQWLDKPRKTTEDCTTFRNAWNLFSDIASAIEGHQAHIDDQKEQRIYDKLFCGNNLPSMTPPGEYYEPVWTKSEVSRLLNVFRKGMTLFRQRRSSPPTRH